jgi:hypothetical protein
MKLLRIFFTLSFFAMILHFSAAAQDDATVLNQIMTKSAKLYNGYPIEKVYLHFDKPYYAVGDTIWFKAYLTYYNHQPSELSKIIYVDVIGPSDTLVQALRLQVKNSAAWGNVPVAKDLFRKGNYRVVAYTKYMNNSGVEYFFNKTITIGDAVNNSLSTQISLKSSGSTKQPKISAGIYYKDNEGKPFSEKKVSWTVQKEDQTIAKGKGVTDKDGFIDISFINLKKVGLDSANIVTTIDDGDRKTLSSTFSLGQLAKTNDIQFFPEGGSLIVGLRTKIAFKAIRPDGLGIDLKGTITDNNNNVVAEFTSSHLGMGAFMLTPEDGKTYKANITFADGTTTTADMSKILTGGINLSLENNNPDNLMIRLQADPQFIKEYQGKTFFILAKSGGIICYAAKTGLQSQFYGATVPKSKFPTGIVQVTLFTGDGEPISERIAFIQHNDQLNLALSGDKQQYDTRQMVKLSLSAKNNGQPDEGNFSVSVTDESKVPYDENSETTILSYLLLTSDIKGYIEKPNYYFLHQDDKTLTDLDNLLLTQGYRRFSYNDVLNNRFPALISGTEQGIDISGSLRASNGLPINRGNVRLSIPDKGYSANAVTDADGRFKFQNLAFSDSSKVTVSARNLVITIDNEAAQGVPINLNTPDELVNIDSALNVYLKNSKLQNVDPHMLKEVVIKDTKIVKLPSHRDYGSLASLSDIADHVISADKFEGCPNMLECIKALAAGMTFDNNNFYVARDFTAGKRQPVAIFLRGTIIDANLLNSVNTAEVASVEIFLRDDLGLINSAYGTNGAIVVNMKKPAEGGKKVSLQELKAMIPQRNEITFIPKGYEAIQTFYLPKYSGPRGSQTTRTDLRTTIYWNPNVNTDKTGAATLEYYNADGQGTYRVTVEGIDKDGNLGRQVFRYTVK